MLFRSVRISASGCGEMHRHTVLPSSGGGRKDRGRKKERHPSFRSMPFLSSVSAECVYRRSNSSSSDNGRGTNPTAVPSGLKKSGLCVFTYPTASSKPSANLQKSSLFPTFGDRDVIVVVARGFHVEKIGASSGSHCFRIDFFGSFAFALFLEVKTVRVHFFS